MENQGKRYDVIAKDFAAMRNEFYTEKKYLDILISYLRPKAKILDIGCGSGFPISHYLDQQGFQITGVDGSKELIKIAKKNYPAIKFVYGDIREILIKEKYDAIVEWWCLFHLPKSNHEQMIARFASWLKKDGILEFTTGDYEFEGTDDKMLNQPLSFFSLNPITYEKYLKKNNFKVLLREHDQDQHLVWIARYEGR